MNNMKYNITYSCGHEGTVNLVGKGSDRERKLKWHSESGHCPECYKKMKEEQKEKEAIEHKSAAAAALENAKY